MQLAESIKTYLPQYLSSESTNELIEGLKDFVANGTTKSIYTIPPEGDLVIYQGDALIDLRHYDYRSKEEKVVPSIVISNTCDIAIENIRKESKNMCYAPLMKLSSFYEALLKKFDKCVADSTVSNIKLQKTHNILYLPQGANLPEDYIAFLDKITNIDNRYICRNSLCKKRLFTLSNTGFYLFLLKLSINFTRIQEKVDRSFNVGSE